MACGCLGITALVIPSHNSRGTPRLSTAAVGGKLAQTTTTSFTLIRYKRRVSDGFVAGGMSVAECRVE